MEIVEKYFPNLTDEQKRQFGMLKDLYSEWNDKINVISRKDIDNLYVKHVLHSLAIAKVVTFKPGTKILDVEQGEASQVFLLPYYFQRCSLRWLIL